MSEKVKRICVVGAGAAGLTAIKSCLEEGLEVICFEKTSNISGIWCYRDKLIEGVGSVHKSTITNSSKEFNSFSDFPFPKEFPNYMNHKKMFEYFELYAKHFNLFPFIRFECPVLKVYKTDDYDSTHRLKVVVKDNKENTIFSEIFDGVMVCTGHHTTPRLPDFPDQHLFKGKIIHSRDFSHELDLRQYEDRNAVVVGIGNSGCDAAVELSNYCDKVFMALRRGGWVQQRLGPNGIPIDCQYTTRFVYLMLNVLPFALICWYFETYVFNRRFNHRLYGIDPNFRCFPEIPIISDDLPQRILCGRVVPKRNIERFTEEGIVFIVVMATGYHHSYPLIDKSLFEHSDDEYLELYKQVFPKQLSHPSLALIGAVQPNRGIFPLFEIQSRWYALLMTGKCLFPSHDKIVADITKANQMRDKLFYKSPRNALAVNRISYMDEIADIIGVKPDINRYLFNDFPLFCRLVFGSHLSYQYRLRGPHCWSEARDALMQSEYRLKYPLNSSEAKVSMK